MKKSLINILGLLYFISILFSACNTEPELNEISGIDAEVIYFNSDTKQLVLNTNVEDTKNVYFVFNETQKLVTQSNEGKASFNLSKVISEDTMGGTKFKCSVTSFDLPGKAQVELDYLPTLVVQIDDLEEKALYVEDFEKLIFPEIKVNYSDDFYSVSWSVHYQPYKLGRSSLFTGMNLYEEDVIEFENEEELKAYVKDENNLYTKITVKCSVNSNSNPGETATAIQILELTHREL